MTWQLTIHSWLTEEIDETAAWYQSQFSTGAADFLLAIEDTLARIERFPYSGPKRSPQDPSIRGLPVKNTQAAAGQARRFPYLIVYQVQENSQIIVAYQLWPMQSGKTVSDAP